MGGDRWKFRAGARAALVMAVVGIAGVTAGCGSSEDGGSAATSATSTGGGAPLRGKKVQFLSCVDTNTFCGTTNRYVTERLGEKGVEVTVQQANFDPVQQALQFDQAIAARPDLIMIQVADPNAIVPSLRKARAAGIPVVNTIGRLNEASYEQLAASVECDCDALGRQAAQNIVRGLRELGLRSGNVVAITGSRAQNISADRIKAFEDELAKTPEYRLVAVEDGNWADGASADIYRQLAAKFAPQGGIQAVWGMADNQTNAIIQAAKQNGQPVGLRARGLIAVGTSCQPITIRNLKSGDQYAGSTNSPITEAKPLVEVAQRLLAGEQVEPITRAEESIVTAANVDQFTGECDFGA